MPNAPTLAATCLAALVVLLVAERRGNRLLRAVAKTIASLAFVGVALALDATSSTYGRLVLLGLVLSLAGDLLLLSDRTAGFLSGLAAFLTAHLAYAAAFAWQGLSWPVTAAAAPVAVALGAAVLRWLRSGLTGPFRIAVAAYVAVILTMCCVAAGHVAAGGPVPALAGALAFAASDLAVARERFLLRSFLNKAWGLPAYYGAQLVLASTVATGQ